MKKNRSSLSGLAMAAALGFIALNASALAQTTLYWGGGTTDISGTSVDTLVSGTTNFGGTWNTATLNWNADSTATTGYEAWVDGNIAAFKHTNSTALTSIINLAGDIQVSGLAIGMPAGNTGQNTHLRSTDATGRMLTFLPGTTVNLYYGDTADYFSLASAVSGTAAVTLAGTSGFTVNSFGGTWGSTGRSLNGVFRVANPATISGDVTINSGYLQIQGNLNNSTNSFASGGSLNQIGKFTVNGAYAALEVADHWDGTGADPIGDTAEIVLNNGNLYWHSISSGTNEANETIGKITLNGNGKIFTNENVMTGGNSSNRGGGGTAVNTLTITNGFDRGVDGKGTLVQVGKSDRPLNAAGGLVISAGLPENTFLPWAMSDYTDATLTSGSGVVRFLQTDSLGNLERVASVSGTTDLALWSGSLTGASDIHFDFPGGFTNALTANTEVRSIAVGVSNSLGTAGTIELGGWELKTQAIAYASNINNTKTLTIGGTTGGTITSPNSDLYLLVNRETNAGAGPATAMAVKAAITGTMNVIFGGYGRIQFTGTNTYTGKTYINSSPAQMDGSVELSGNGSILSTPEINLSSNAMFKVTPSSSIWTLGGGSVAQTLSGVGTVKAGATTITLKIGGVSSSGTLSPGNAGPGTFTFTNLGIGKLSFSSLAHLAFDIGTESDLVTFTAPGDYLTGSGNLTLDLATGLGFATNTAYTVFNNVTTSGFTLAGVTLDGTPLSATDYTFLSDGNSYSITLLVPEPTSWMMLLGGAGMLTFFRRRSIRR